ncbi:hypothetical protein PCE1_002881 [Barthelona sp. PCE]
MSQQAITKINRILHRLDSIIDENGGIKEDTKQLKLSVWKSTRNELSSHIKSIREMVEHRDQIAAKKPHDRQVRQLTAQIRSELSNLKEEYEDLEGLKTSKVKKNTQDDAPEIREQVLDLAQQHISQIESSLSRKKPSREAGERVKRSSLFAQKKNGEPNQPTPTKPLISEQLPELDCDEGLAQIYENIEIQDGKLEVLYNSIVKTTDTALVIGDELDKHEELVEVISDKTQKATEQISDVNKRIKKAIVSVRGGEKCTLDLILLVLVVSIAYYIYQMLSKA